MKKSKNKLFIVIFLTLILLLGVLNVNSFGTEVPENTEDEETSEVLTTTSLEDYEEDTQVHNGDLYVLFGENDVNNQTYVMDKKVDGNVFIMGNDVKITGAINGSLFIVAKTITIEKTAYIASHTFACAQSIIMEGYTIDMYAVAENFDMTKEGAIYRDLKLACETANLRGIIGRDLDLLADNIDVYENEEDHLVVYKNCNYTSTDEVENMNNIVKGNVNFKKQEETNEDINVKKENVFGDLIYKSIKNVLFTLMVYLLLVLLTPKFVEKSKEYVSTRGLIAAAVGLAFVILVPIFAILLFITILGIPFAFITIMVYVIILMIQNSITSVAINEFIAGKYDKINTIWKKMLSLALIQIVLSVITQIPVIGGLISAVIFLAGAGIITLYQFDKRLKKEIEA